MDPKFSIGIDLGTTHSVLSFVDLKNEDEPVQELLLSQYTEPGVLQEFKQLPSFIYIPQGNEFETSQVELPYIGQPKYLCGYLARHLGAKTPTRLVASAKSWLCHSRIDRRQPQLPFPASEGVAQISPLDASAAYLETLKLAWDSTFPEAPLDQQDLTITIPASFDPAARDLTAEAAKLAGIPNFSLLEEPQAALYHWLNASGDQWREQLSIGDIVLVIDIGGGTCDFSLIAVSENEGELQLNRIAVGDHILLGGDNMDLALAYRVATKLQADGQILQPWQIQAITQACRDAKETLLLNETIDDVAISIPNRGSNLFAKALRCQLTRVEVEELILDGFFPVVGLDSSPQSMTRSGLAQIGLPYAQDAAISRHLASFLQRQAKAADPFLAENNTETFIRPSAVLFNGGVLKAPRIAQRIFDCLQHWLGDNIRQLAHVDLDLSVAGGAAYYGAARRGNGVRIRGGLASSYYVGVASAMPAIPGMPPPQQALCVAPFGMEMGNPPAQGQHQFSLVVGEPVTFQFYQSTTRRDDTQGSLLDHWVPNELEALPDLHTTLHSDNHAAGDLITVQIAACVDEIGILQLDAIAVDGSGTWRINFDPKQIEVT